MRFTITISLATWEKEGQGGGMEAGIASNDVDVSCSPALAQCRAGAGGHTINGRFVRNDNATITLTIAASEQSLNGVGDEIRIIPFVSGVGPMATYYFKKLTR